LAVAQVRVTRLFACDGHYPWLARERRCDGEGTEGQTGDQASRRYQLSITRAHPPLYSLHFIYPTSIMPWSDAPWRLTWDDISYRTEIKRTPDTHASRGRGQREGWAVIIVGGTKRFITPFNWRLESNRIEIAIFRQNRIEIDRKSE